MSYYFNKILDNDFENVLEDVVISLKKEGFGVLTEIDVQDTFKKKLDVDFQRYVILGACNPIYAHKALQVEDKIGVMLPCNITIQELDGKVHVTAIDPVTTMRVVENPEVELIAKEIQQKLVDALDHL